MKLENSKDTLQQGVLTIIEKGSIWSPNSAIFVTGYEVVPATESHLRKRGH